MILTISQDRSEVHAVPQADFEDLAILERNIQAWVEAHPDILLQGQDERNPDLLIVAREFDDFRFKDDSVKDRLDLLAMDRKRNLVVIEFKRDQKSGQADLHALRYAAMVSSMRLEQLVPIYRKYLEERRSGEPVPTDEFARQRIIEFAFSEAGEGELSNEPRIILCSRDFSPQITTTVLWLRSKGIDISCVKLSPHDVDGRIMVVPTLIIPLKEAREYQIEIAQKEKAQVQAQERVDRARFDFKKLLERNILCEGQVLTFKAPDWAAVPSGDPMLQAVVTGYPPVLRWKHDQQTYSPSRLGSVILAAIHREHNPPKGDPQAKKRWVNQDGTSLEELEMRATGESEG